MSRGQKTRETHCTQTFDFQNASENSRANHVAGGRHRTVVVSFFLVLITWNPPPSYLFVFETSARISHLALLRLKMKSYWQL